MNRKKHEKDKNRVEYNLKKLNIKEFGANTNTYDSDDENECPICLSKNEKIVSLECKHNMCERCICRLSVLLKTKLCPVCKQENVVCTNKTYMAHKCLTCAYEAKSIVDLIVHYKTHKIILCEECFRHKNEFWDEYVLYNIDEIQLHKRNGTLEENKNGFYGHIYCHFCKKYFYDADECKKHCRKAHFLCTVCENVDNRHQYFNNHADLCSHLREMHYVCDFPECNGISFAYKVGLVEHLLKAHKIGSGTVNLKKETKTGTIPVMAPFDIESANKKQKTPVNVGNRYTSKFVPNITKTVPNAMNRNIFRQEINTDYIFCEAMKKKYPSHYEEFLKASSMYLSHELSPELYLEKIEILIGGKETIKYAEHVLRFYKFDDSRVLSEYLKTYKNQVMFPKFVKNDKKEDVKKKEKEKFGFRMIEIKKTKK